MQYSIDQQKRALIHKLPVVVHQLCYKLKFSKLLYSVKLYIKHYRNEL